VGALPTVPSACARSDDKHVLHSRSRDRLLDTSDPDGGTAIHFKTVDSTNGSLRSTFRDLGREGQDNPAAARVVKACWDVTNEQLVVGLVPEQATPVFSANLRVASLANLDALTTAVGASRFTLLRTRAMLLVAVVSLLIGKQLGETKSEAVMRFPDNRGLLFNYLYGTTLRSDRKHVLGCCAPRMWSCAQVPP
jgi:hypothetical protein